MEESAGISQIIEPRRKKRSFKYKLSLRKYWWSWFKLDIKRLYYKNIWGFEMGGFGGTMLPDTGKGKYVSVYTKGQIIQIINEENKEEVRLIPYQPNHGIMVETWVKGKMRGRNHLDFRQLSNSGSSIEEEK